MTSTISQETREKMSLAKKKNPTKYWQGKGELLRKPVAELSGSLPDYIRKQALERAQHRCTYCSSNKKLHVHHLDGKDGRSNKIDPPNHTLENLIVVCPKCHEGIHKNYLLANAARLSSQSLICKLCGKSFMAQKWEINRGRRYCSHNCYSKAKIGQPSKKKCQYPVECVVCGRELYLPRNRLEKFKCCSKQCLTIYNSNSFKNQ